MRIGKDWKRVGDNTLSLISISKRIFAPSRKNTWRRTRLPMLALQLESEYSKNCSRRQLNFPHSLAAKRQRNEFYQHARQRGVRGTMRGVRGMRGRRARHEQNMRGMNNPAQHKLLTVKLTGELFKLTCVLFRLTGVLFRLTGVFSRLT